MLDINLTFTLFTCCNKLLHNDRGSCMQTEDMGVCAHAVQCAYTQSRLYTLKPGQKQFLPDLKKIKSH